MEKIKERFASAKAAVEKSRTRAEAARIKAEDLERESDKKDEELSVLMERVKLLDELFETTMIKYKEMSQNQRDAELRAEQSEKRAIKLKQEVQAWDKKNAELVEKIKALKAELNDLDAGLEDL
ncbi:hypothetical protein BX666DRAFT_330530 [Dichotomocladium elegans]|nr:hypothetical protein BX666DRAFT_330530 [Dichotomocladium elegans]